MKTIGRSLLGAAATSVAAHAAAQTAADLVLLPARPDAWRVVASHWEGQAELTTDSVMVPPPRAEYARDTLVGASDRTAGGQREALAFEWQKAWSAGLRMESRQPLDLRPYLNGTVEFDIAVDAMAQGAVKVKLSCGAGCERSVSLLQPARGWAGQGWQHVSLAMSCFVRDGADFSSVTTPFALEGNGSGRVSVAHVRLRAAGRPNLSCPDYRTQSVTPEPLQESWAIDWWMPRHEAKLAEIRAHREAGRRVDLVFVGDSITEGWEKAGKDVWARHFAKYNAVALGFGGDRTENLLWRLQHGELDGMTPKAVVMMIGTNNTGHRLEDPALIVAGIKKDLDEIRQRQPQAKVALLAVFPRGEKPDDALRRHNDKVNALLPALADGKQVFFLDIGGLLTGPDGTLSKDVMPDLLHPNQRGYEIWARSMDAMLTPWLQ
ncbi:MAG TPA: GDSL-type esterase/lipase family protein [Magnetospirillum sp.]|nr:GDSL-type esterase/lipase family protein [Magnetospirillum sp.]